MIKTTTESISKQLREWGLKITPQRLAIIEVLTEKQHLHPGGRGAADAERDIRGFAVKFYTEEGNWDLAGNNTPVVFLRDPLEFPDLDHAVKRPPRTNMRSPLFQDVSAG